MTVNSTPQVVTIAGSDSGGGAGIQADLKTFQAREVFGMSILVALTAQNTLGVQESMTVPTAFITSQFASLAADFKLRACKTGMLATTEIVTNVSQNLREVDFGPLIVDPVMVAKGGHSLLESEAIEAIKKDLLPLAFVVTPNLPEAEVILGERIVTEAEIIAAAKNLQLLGTKNVIIKGGHSTGTKATDYILLENGEGYWLSSPRIATANTHGTGDTFSSCIVAELAKGHPLKEAVFVAKRFIQGAITDGLYVGHGHGPTNHWALPSPAMSVFPSKLN